MKKYLLNPLFSPIFLCIFLAGLFGLVYAFRAMGFVFEMEDNLYLESFTYVFYGIAIASAVSLQQDFWGTAQEKTYKTLLFLWFVVLLREMGLQHWLTTHDTTAIKIRFFTNPNNPIHEKIISALVIAAVVIVAGWLIFKYTKKIIVGFFKLNPMYWTICTFGGIGAVSQFCDRFPSNYRKATGTVIEEPWTTILKLLEEGGEATLPLLFTIAFVQYHLLKKGK